MRLPNIPWWLWVESVLLIGIVLSVLLSKHDASIALGSVAFVVTFISHDFRGRARRWTS